MKGTIDRISPDAVVKLATGVFLLIGVQDLVPAGDMVILYDHMEWKPAPYNKVSPKEIAGAPRHIRYIGLSLVSNEYNTVTHICRVWMDMVPLANEWWLERPIVERGNELDAEVPKLRTVLPHHYESLTALVVD